MVFDASEQDGIWQRFVADESGQDAIEYGLLGCLIGISAILIWQQLVGAVFDVYTAADSENQVLGHCTPAPDGSACP